MAKVGLPLSVYTYPGRVLFCSRWFCFPRPRPLPLPLPLAPFPSHGLLPEEEEEEERVSSVTCIPLVVVFLKQALRAPFLTSHLSVLLSSCLYCVESGHACFVSGGDLLLFELAITEWSMFLCLAFLFLAPSRASVCFLPCTASLASSSHAGGAILILILSHARRVFSSSLLETSVPSNKSFQQTVLTTFLTRSFSARYLMDPTCTRTVHIHSTQNRLSYPPSKNSPIYLKHGILDLRKQTCPSLPFLPSSPWHPSSIYHHPSSTTTSSPAHPRDATTHWHWNHRLHRLLSIPHHNLQSTISAQAAVSYRINPSNFQSSTYKKHKFLHYIPIPITRTRFTQTQ